MKVAVLGGLGLMAEAALYDLAQSRSIKEVVAADLNVSRARAVLGKIPQRRKVKVRSLDLTDTAAAARALKGTTVIINCAWYELNLSAMDLALALKAHYIDLGGLYHKTLKQLKRGQEFRSANLLAVLGCGSTPGITNMMVAQMAEAFSRVHTVGIYDASHDPALDGSSFLPPFSIRTMLDEYEMPAPIFIGGKVKEVLAHSQAEPLEFRAPIGKVSAGAVIHSEVATLPAYLKDKGVKNLVFKIAYPERVKAQLQLLSSMDLARSAPVRVNGHEVSPRNFVTALAQEGAKAAVGEPRDFEILRVRLEGSKAGRPLALEWDCEMRATTVLSAGAMGVGFTASIVAHQILAGELTMGSGVYAPESCLVRGAFFKALAARKVFKIIERTESPLRRFQ